MERMSNEQAERFIKELGFAKGKKEAKEPDCYTCYDLGNYEISVLSNGEQIPRWTYMTVQQAKAEGIPVDQRNVDNLKRKQEKDPTITEVLLYRAHCPTCHLKFVEKHDRLVSIIKQEKGFEKDKIEAKAELQKHWGLAMGMKK